MSEKKWKSPSENVKIFLKAEKKSKYQSQWKKEFASYLLDFLNFIFQEDEESVKLALSDTFFPVWVKAFSDESASADNYENLETLGDAFFDTSLTLYIFKKFGDDIPTYEFSNLKLFYRSNAYLKKISERFSLHEWLIYGNPLVPVNDKAIANAVENFCGALGLVTEGVKTMYMKSENHEKAAKTPTNVESVSRFLQLYFDKYGMSLNEADTVSAKHFILNQIPDAFGWKGSISFDLDKAGFYTVNLDDNIIQDIAKNLTDTQIQGVVTKVSSSEIKKILLGLSKIKNKNINGLSKEIKNILNEKLNLNQEWIDNFKSFSRISSLPESLQEELNKKKGRFEGFMFEAPAIDKKGKLVTLILFKKKGDAKGRTQSKTVLATLTKEVENPGLFPFELREELVRKYISI